MKTKTVMIWKWHKKWVACAITGVLLMQSYHMAAAAEPADSMESVSENTVGEDDSREKSEEDAMAERDDAWPEETVSQNSISENNAMDETTAVDGEPIEKREEESVSENTTEESVSENTVEESVSENTVEESVSENTVEESVSENTTQETVSANTMSVDSMTSGAGVRASVPPTAPVIKSVVPKDTTAEIRFTHLLEEEQNEGIQYEVQLTDGVNGEMRTISGKDAGALTIIDYDGKKLNTFRIGRLAVNKQYSVVLRAKYGDTGEAVVSAKKMFTTKKDMIATDGSMKIRYADMEALKNDQTRKAEEMKTAGIEMNVGESCALYAQVSKLMRAVETDKLKWTITALGEEPPKNGLKVKASKSTYEAVLTAEKSGRYQVTVTNTLSKEEAARFQVTVK